VFYLSICVCVCVWCLCVKVFDNRDSIVRRHDPKDQSREEFLLGSDGTFWMLVLLRTSEGEVAHWVCLNGNYAPTSLPVYGEIINRERTAITIKLATRHKEADK